jgi:hypothetical protein
VRSQRPRNRRDNRQTKTDDQTTKPRKESAAPDFPSFKIRSVLKCKIKYGSAPSVTLHPRTRANTLDVGEAWASCGTCPSRTGNAADHENLPYGRRRGSDIYQSVSRVEELFEARKPNPWRTSRKSPATCRCRSEKSRQIVIFKNKLRRKVYPILRLQNKGSRRGTLWKSRRAYRRFRQSSLYF